MNFCEVNPESTEYQRPEPWVCMVRPASAEHGGLYGQTRYTGEVIMTDQHRQIKQLSVLELLKLATERIRGAGLVYSTKPEDIQSGRADPDNPVPTREVDRAITLDSRRMAIIVHGATEMHLAQALRSVADESLTHNVARDSSGETIETIFTLDDSTMQTGTCTASDSSIIEALQEL